MSAKREKANPWSNPRRLLMLSTGFLPDITRILCGFAWLSSFQAGIESLSPEYRAYIIGKLHVNRTWQQLPLIIRFINLYHYKMHSQKPMKIICLQNKSKQTTNKTKQNKTTKNSNLFTNDMVDVTKNWCTQSKLRVEE